MAQPSCLRVLLVIGLCLWLYIFLETSPWRPTRKLRDPSPSTPAYDLGGWRSCKSTLDATLSTWDAAKIPISSRVVLVYHIGPMDTSDPLFGVYEKNVGVLLSSLFSAPPSTPQFTIMNIVGGSAHPLWHRLTSPLPPLACAVAWERAGSDIETHMNTASMLGKGMWARFGALGGLNQGVRGPLAGGPNLQAYAAALLRTPNHTFAMVAPLLSCQIQPHLQTHMFLLNTAALPDALEHAHAPPPPNHNPGNWLESVVYRLEVGLSTALMAKGWELGYMVEEGGGVEAYTQASCPRPDSVFDNPSTGCHINPRVLGFVKFGGEIMRRGLMCEQVLEEVNNWGGKGG